MSYTKTVWSNNQSPALDANNLNKIENGIYNAQEDASTAISTSASNTTAISTLDGRITSLGQSVSNLVAALNTRITSVDEKADANAENIETNYNYARTGLSYLYNKSEVAEDEIEKFNAINDKYYTFNRGELTLVDSDTAPIKSFYVGGISTKSSGTLKSVDNVTIVMSNSDGSDYVSKEIPYVLRGIGNVCDTIEIKKYTNMKSVDMGSLVWTISTSSAGLKYADATITDIKTVADNVLPNIITSFCETITNSAKTLYTTDYAICLANNHIQLRNVVDNTVAELKTRLSGNMLHYEATSGGEAYETFVLTRKIGTDNLGTHDYTVNSSNGAFTFTRGKIGAAQNGKMLSFIYEQVDGAASATGNHMMYCGASNIGFTYEEASGNVNTFKTAMNGVELLYELASPTIKEVTQNYSALQTYYPKTNVYFTAENNVVPSVTFNYLRVVANDSELFLTSPNGTRYKITVSNNGTLSATAI